MPRCEGYYTLENSRCPNEGDHQMKASDGHAYALCEYHADAVWTTTVARWHGETDLRASAPVELQTAAREPAFAWS